MERCCCCRSSWMWVLMLELLSVMVMMAMTVGCFVPTDVGQISPASSRTGPASSVNRAGPVNPPCDPSANCTLTGPHDGAQRSEPSLTTMAAGQLLAAIIRHSAHWSYVIVIFDDHYEGEVPQVTRHLAEGGTSYMLYGYSQLDPRTSGGGGLESLLPLGTNSWLRPCRFLLLCSPANSKNVLRQAEHFQTMHKQRSALFMTSQWLVLVDPGAFERSDVSHVSMMHVTFVSCHAGKACCLPTSPRNDERCGMVRTLQWRGGDNSVVCLGSVLDILNGGRDVFPARHWGFSGRLLSVSTLPWKGFVELRETAKGTEYSGLCIDLLRQLALLMNFTYQLSQPADSIWGIQYDNGTWAGLIGQLATSEVDMVMAPLTVTYQRELVMDFTYPYFNDADTVIYRKPDPRKDKWRTYLQPLKWQVLVCIAISLLCTTLLLGFIESRTPFYPANRVPHLTRRHSSYFHSFRLIYGALFAQATDDHLPRSLSGRLLVSGWWLFSIVVAATYSGNLVAFFTVTKTKPLFYTLHDLLAQDTYKIGFMGGSAIHHTVKVSSSHLHSSLWSEVSGWLQEDPAYLTTNISVHRARLMAGGYALIADKTTLEGWAKQECSLELTRETFLPIEYGVGLPNDSAFTRVFSQKILQMHENGQLAKVRDRWWPDNPTCDQSTTTTLSSPTVTLLEVQSAFFLLLIGLGLGLLVLTAEYGLTLPVWATLHKCLVQEKNS